MRTSEERIEALHRRVQTLEKQKARRELAGFGSAAAFFACLLTVIIVQTGDLAQSAGDQYAGASLLDEDTGGYVLAAVIAFFIGVIVTAAIFRYRRR